MERKVRSRELQLGDCGELGGEDNNDLSPMTTTSLVVVFHLNDSNSAPSGNKNNNKGHQS